MGIPKGRHFLFAYIFIYRKPLPKKEFYLCLSCPSSLQTSTIHKSYRLLTTYRLFQSLDWIWIGNFKTSESIAMRQKLTQMPNHTGPAFVLSMSKIKNKSAFLLHHELMFVSQTQEKLIWNWNLRCFVNTKPCVFSSGPTNYLPKQDV